MYTCICSCSCLGLCERHKQVVSDLADLDETKYDMKTLERLKGLVAEKQKCVDVEAVSCLSGK